MAKNSKVKVGDIVAIPVGEKGYVLGQFVEKTKGHQLYLAVYEGLYSLPKGYKTVLLGDRRFADLSSIPISIPDNITDQPILFWGQTVNALLYHGIWHIVGNRKTKEERMPRPYYKVHNHQELMIQNFNDSKRITATVAEFDSLDYQSSYTPIVFQDTIEAHYGLIPKKDYMRELEYDNLMEKSNFRF